MAGAGEGSLAVRSRRSLCCRNFYTREVKRPRTPLGVVTLWAGINQARSGIFMRDLRGPGALRNEGPEIVKLSNCKPTGIGDAAHRPDHTWVAKRFPTHILIGAFPKLPRMRPGGVGAGSNC